MAMEMNSTLEHTFALLARLDLLIRREVIRLRLAQGQRADEEFRGLYVSEEEVDRLLDGSLSPSALLAAPLPDSASLTSFQRAATAVDRKINAIESAARARGETLRFARLCQLFELSELEREILVVALAAELDLKYERLYAYLQDDVTKKRPTVDLVMRLLCPDLTMRVAGRGLFEPDSPLMRWQLISLHDDPGARRPVLLARYLKLDDRVAAYLLGSDQLDARLLPLAVPSSPEIPLPVSIQERLARWGQAWESKWAGRAPVVLLNGRYGTGKRTAARALAAWMGVPLLLFNAPDLLSTKGLSLFHATKLAEREARLQGGLVGWNEADIFLNPNPDVEAEHRAFVDSLVQSRVPVVLLAEKAWEPAREMGGRPFLQLELPEPTYDERRKFWLAGLNGSGERLSEAELNSLAARFRLTAGQIQDAVTRARTLAWAQDPSNGHLHAADLDAASRGQAQHRLSALARKLELRYTWDDIVLPRPQLTALRLICATLRQRPTVYGEWGFDRKLSNGKGLIALFAGPSGTGKTMAAEIIGHELGLDVYKIDLSAVVSKYIGETEKNLERIFEEAQKTDAILFFDEADALFGKRSEVKDAHDRYANIEIAYLLQRTETYNGLVILASNIKKNMDEAFVRRLHFTIDFPSPEEPERLEIWRRTFPPQAPKAADIDLGFLARKLKITGGNIRNIILTAAFLAAEEGEPIAMRHLVRGASYEYQKMGKMVVESDFGHYVGFAQG